VEKAIQYFEDEDYIKAFKALIEIKDKRDKNYKSALFYLGYCYCHFKKYTDAEQTYLELLNTTKTNDDKALYLHQISMVKRLKEDYEGALHYNQQELSLRKKFYLQAPLEMATLYYETSLIRLLEKKYDLALESAEQALNYANQSLDKMTLGCVCRLYGDIYLKLGNKKMCRKYYENSLRSFIITGDGKAIEGIKKRIIKI